MTRHSAAIAVFVKTPGLSPIKTRLTAGIGPELSAEFYRLSVAAIAATVAGVANSTGATPYWAVAEETGLDDPLWQHFSQISQGNGDLGYRLHKVFDELQSQHAAVIAIGADSPQLTSTLLEDTLKWLLDNPRIYSHVLGCSHDGGFYLVGSNSCLAQQTWTAVPYSTAIAAQSLTQGLRTSGQLKELIRLSDVDTAEDLVTLRIELLALSSPTPEQGALLKWIEQNMA